MWKPIRFRLALSLFLGVLGGIALLSLPAFLSPSYEQPGPDTAGRILTMSNKEALMPEPTPGLLFGDSSPDAIVTALKLFLVLLPGSVLAFVARRWAARKLPDWYY